MKRLFAIAMLLPLAGCAMDTSMQKAEAEATRAGCLCANAGCAVSIAASGQAAVGAEISGVLRTIAVDKPTGSKK